MNSGIYHEQPFNESSKIKLKEFSVEFSKLILNNTTSTLDYNVYLKGKEIVELKCHSDLFSFVRGTHFLEALINNIENVMIPTYNSYGFYSIFIANYSKIRAEITSSSFLPEAKASLLKVYDAKDVAQLEDTFLKAQNLISRHESILDYSHTEFSLISPLINFYFLHLYFLEI